MFYDNVQISGSRREQNNKGLIEVEIYRGWI